MPCMDGGPDPNDCREEERREAVKRDQKRRLDLATRVACELANNLNVEEQSHLSTEAQEWIKEHREADRQRIEQEEILRRQQIREKEQKKATAQLRAKALLKLTPEERAVLGI